VWGWVFRTLGRHHIKAACKSHRTSGGVHLEQPWWRFPPALGNLPATTNDDNDKDADADDEDTDFDADDDDDDKDADANDDDNKPKATNYPDDDADDDDDEEVDKDSVDSKCFSSLCCFDFPVLFSLSVKQMTARTNKQENNKHIKPLTQLSE
jgi:hypothetical protein